MPYKHNEPRRHKIPKARYRVENSREYEVALRDRGSLTVWVTPEAIAAWHPARTGRPGRSAHYSDLAIETSVMPRLAFARPWRQTEGLLRSVTTLLGLSLDVPDHTTLSRRSAALSLVTALAVPAGPVTVVIDSTGLKVFGAGEWRMAKHVARDRRTWRKLHLAIDPDTGEVLASAWPRPRRATPRWFARCLTRLRPRSPPSWRTARMTAILSTGRLPIGLPRPP